jgi:general secretion pathway protein K
MNGHARSRQRGAALLLAMLTVTLVATLASAALWQQWRATEIEQAERQRVQAGWILTGALDWARLILREDARSNQNSGNADHLGEPWALPLEEARLSSFLAADKNNNTDNTLQAFLSGEMIDMQSRLNFTNLVRTNGGGATAKAETPEADLRAFARLFEQLGLPQAELTKAAEELRNTTQLALTDPLPSRTALVPRKLSQLSWLGLSRATLSALEPHVTVLPERSSLNFNTASPQAIFASVPGMDMAQARQVVAARERNPFKNLSDVTVAVPVTAGKLTDEAHGTRSRYFEVRGRLRLENTVIEERSLVVRNNLDVRVSWRERFARP